MSDNTGMRRYSQLAAMSQRRLEELAEAGTLVPGSTFARKPAQRRPLPELTGPDQATVLLVLKRALRWVDGTLVSCCEVCGEPVFGTRSFDWSVHHRRGREGTRTDNRPVNLLIVCGVGNAGDGCHPLIHSRPSWSRSLGLLLSRNDRRDPAGQPACLDREGRWVYLTVAGGYSTEPPGLEVA